MTGLLFQLSEICRRESERLQLGQSEVESRKTAESDRQLYLDSDLTRQSSKLQVCLTWLRSQSVSSTAPANASIWLSSGLFIFTGFILGLLTMSGVIAYSGDNPVNIIYWLIIFVFFQWLMITITTAMAILNPQRKGLVAERIEALLRRSNFKDLPPELMPSLFFRVNQWIAVSFLIGAILTFLLAIVSQDIAFGWSTTLTVDTDKFIAGLQALTWPWQSWWGDAVPDAELIRQTLFFRIVDVDSTMINPQIYGHWWPFLVACLIFYSLVPRLILLIIAQVVFLRAVERVCTENTLLSAVVRRMTSPLIVMASPSHSVDENPIEAFSDLPIIDWSDINKNYSDASLLCWRTSEPDTNGWKGSTHQIGAGNFTDDILLLQGLTSEQPILWVIPGWEPPLAELKDLLAISKQLQILVLQSLPGVSLTEADQISWDLFAKSLQGEVNLLGIIKQDGTND